MQIQMMFETKIHLRRRDSLSDGNHYSSIAILPILHNTGGIISLFLIIISVSQVSVPTITGAKKGASCVQKAN